MGYAIVFILLLTIIIIVNIVYKNSSSKKYSDSEYFHPEIKKASDVDILTEPAYNNIPGNIYHVNTDSNQKDNG